MLLYNHTIKLTSTIFYYTAIFEDTIMKKNLFGICPYLTTQKLLSGKWSIYILHILSNDSVRFNELQRRIPESITHTTLSKQLKTLELEKLIVRKEYKQIPPKVEYSLSEIGMQFISVLEAINIWGTKYIEYTNNDKNK